MWKDDGLDAASILMEIVKGMLGLFVWDSRHFKQDFGALPYTSNRLRSNQMLENVFAWLMSCTVHPGIHDCVIYNPWSRRSLTMMTVQKPPRAASYWT